MSRIIAHAKGRLVAKYLFAKYGRFVGPNCTDSDYVIRDPHEFGLEAIVWAQYYAEGGELKRPMTYADAFKINVVKTEGKLLFEDFTISAPLEIWEKIVQSLTADAL